MIEFKNFGFKYNAQVDYTLRDINLKINPGEKVLIAGPSGCGKSTLIHCLNGLIPFALEGEREGTLKVDGKDTWDMSIFELSKKVGTVLQDQDSQFIGLTVAEDLAFALENDAVEEPELHDRVAEISEVVNINTHLLHSPQELSGGQKQRVSLGGVLIEDVDVLLFDEPLANLDPETGKKAIELIDEIHKKTGDTVIIVEHRLEDVLWRPVDRIILMEKGRITADTTPDELLSTEVLKRAGVREPLYVTALKYAGVEITPEMKASSLDTIILTDEQKQKVRDWFKAGPLAEKKSDEEEILTVRDLNFTYRSDRSDAEDHQALIDVDFDLYKGEMMAIVGRNGAGKSTFSKVVCGFEMPDTGTMIMDGMDLSTLSIKERADHIGYIMQNPNQMISKTMIFDEVAMGLRNRGGITEEKITERVNHTLQICGLWPFRNWPISALSYGQKKRVTIAAIMSMEPEIMILDEPTAGQDYRHYTEIMEFLKELNERGTTVVLITHDMHLMLEYAERSVVFSDGRIIACDTAANILTNDDIIKRASLKETSLYRLAKLCGIDEGQEFVSR
ncbi:MAG: ABC transporter ATP-binding protein, partial [Clostridiales bacterium]|nr:ABC transporter ATP-binding protein [Clostridiales bacterium]